MTESTSIIPYVTSTIPLPIPTSLPHTTPLATGVHSVSTENVQWSDKEEYETRVKHEAAGVLQIQINEKIVKTISEMYAFVLLGPHKGLHSYVHGAYVTSEGAGWEK